MNRRIAVAGTVTPPWAAVLAVQLRAEGAACRAELAVVVGLMVGTALLLIAAGRHVAEGVDFSPVDLVWPVLLLALASPLAVWKGAEPSRRAYFWAMPVDRRRHTLLRVLAGWLWLLALLAVHNACGVVVALGTGGQVMPGSGVHGWLWLVPVAAATVAYLFGSVIALRSEHPWRWLVGGALAYVPLLLLSELGALQSFGVAFSQLPAPLARLGFTTLATGAVSGQPSIEAWAPAAALWLAAALLSAILAAHRYQD
jgi:hypothetical protein